MRIARLESSLKDRSMLEGEILKLREILQKKMDELDESYRKISMSELSLAEASDLKTKIKVYEEKVVSLTTEIERLLFIIGEKNEEIENHSLKLAQNDVAIRDRQGLLNEINRMKELLERKLDESEKYKLALSRYESERSQVEFKISKMNEYENRVVALSAEINRVANIIKESFEENHSLKVRCISLETELKDKNLLKEELERLKEILENKLRENDRLNSELARIDMLELDKKTLASKLYHSETRLVSLSRELSVFEENFQKKNAEVS